MPVLARRCRTVRLQPLVNAEGSAGRIGNETYDAQTERESIARTLVELGLEEMHLVGWSNGGRMTLDFALAEADRVRSLTLVDPAAWWLVEDIDSSGKGFADFVAECAGRELDGDDLERFLVKVGVAGLETRLPSAGGVGALVILSPSPVLGTASGP